jgi:hypothetical protein
MKKHALLATAIVALLLVSVATTRSSGAAAPAQKGAKAELFAVVQIGEELKIVRKSELTSLKKSVKEEDNRRQKAYDDSKKNKGKDKGAGKGAEMGMGAGMGMGPGMGRDADQYEMSKPAKRTVKILKNSLKTELDAREYLLEQQGTKTSKKTDAW